MSDAKKNKPLTIAERGWCDYTIDYLEQALDAARTTKSGLSGIRCCDSCLRPFDETDPRAYCEDKTGTTLLGEEIVQKLGWCPACNIEASPDLALAALEKAADMNPQFMPVDAHKRCDALLAKARAKDEVAP